MKRRRYEPELLVNLGVKLNLNYCGFFQKIVSFLWYTVSEKCVKTDPETTVSVEEWPLPKN